MPSSLVFKGNIKRYLEVFASHKSFLLVCFLLSISTECVLLDAARGTCIAIIAVKDDVISHLLKRN